MKFTFLILFLFVYIIDCQSQTITSTNIVSVNGISRITFRFKISNGKQETNNSRYFIWMEQAAQNEIYAENIRLIEPDFIEAEFDILNQPEGYYSLKIYSMQNGILTKPNFFELNNFTSTKKSLNNDLKSQQSNISGINNHDTPLCIYPNPSYGIITISGRENFKARLLIRNNEGKLLEQTIINGTTEIDLSSYTKGIYYIQFFSDDKKIATKKIIID